MAGVEARLALPRDLSDELGLDSSAAWIDLFSPPGRRSPVWTIFVFKSFIIFGQL